MLDLFHTLQDLQAWNVSLVAQTGLQFDLRSAQGKLIASLMSALAEFERDLLRERVRSGIAAARKRGVVFGRRPGQRIKADRCAAKVLKLVAEGQSYREISHRLGLRARLEISVSSGARKHWISRRLPIGVLPHLFLDGPLVGGSRRLVGLDPDQLSLQAPFPEGLPAPMARQSAVEPPPPVPNFGY